MRCAPALAAAGLASLAVAAAVAGAVTGAEALPLPSMAVVVVLVAVEVEDFFDFFLLLPPLLSDFDLFVLLPFLPFSCFVVVLVWMAAKKGDGRRGVMEGRGGGRENKKEEADLPLAMPTRAESYQRTQHPRIDSGTAIIPLAWSRR